MPPCLRGSPGGFPGRATFLLDQPLDVLDDDDRVVDEEADCQHHSKQGESVDAEPGDAHHSESAQQHDRDGDGGDEGRADVLQKQEHDEEYEDHRLEEGLDDLL